MIILSFNRKTFLSLLCETWYFRFRQTPKNPPRAAHQAPTLIGC